MKLRTIFTLLSLLIISCNQMGTDTFSNIRNTHHSIVTSDKKVMIYQSSFNTDNKIHTTLTSWIKQKGHQGGGGLFDIYSDNKIDIKMRWLNDSIAEVVIPQNIEIIRKTDSTYFLGKKIRVKYIESDKAYNPNFDMIKNFKEVISTIKDSDIYENKQNWESRGLNQSDKLVITLLRKSTNDFLNKLDKIVDSNKAKESKLRDINKIVDNLPWIELDTEEKEFLADVIAPAIESAGFNPWSII